MDYHPPKIYVAVKNNLEKYFLLIGGKEYDE